MQASYRFTSYACSCLLVLFSTIDSQVQASNLIQVNASQPYSAPAPVVYNGGTATSPNGHVIALNSRFLTLDGKPWLPVMGEFHYSRYPEAQWEEEILKMKASGVQIISTYVIWIHQEEIEGQFDWSAQRDLRKFAQLCAKHGMYLVVRVGPWSHGELRNGGFPDWLLTKGPTRRNDPVFLSYVQKYFAQIGQQLQGMMWKDGGPVIGVQLSNEYSMRGPGAGNAYILELKKLARQSGMDVPLYLETGWDNAAIPPGAVLPVFGGYPAAPWGGTTTKLPASEVYAFRFDNRVTGDMGAVGQKNKPAASAGENYPYLTAEVGGGIQDTYHRRPVIRAHDIASISSVLLGSGVNLYGSYMFQGGENPEGKKTTLEESQTTGSATDVPVESYDFQAPLGEFGQERESFRKLKLFQYFMNDFGAELAPMTVHAPSIRPKDPADFSVPRIAVRSRNNAGFVFFNNYVRGYTMPARKSLQIQIKLPGQTLTMPRHPVDIPSGAYFIWPFNLNIGTALLHYSTAQLFTRLEESGETTYVFFAVPGIPTEFAFDASTAKAVKANGAQVEEQNGITYVTGLHPGTNAAIELETAQGNAIRLLLFTQQEAESAWKATFSGVPHLLLTAQDFYADTDSIYLQSRGDARFAFAVTPPLRQPLHGSAAIHNVGNSAHSSEFEAHLPAVNFTPSYRKVHSADPVPPVRLGPALSWRPHGVAEAPPDSEFKQAAEWELTVPPNALAHLNNLFLKVTYQGDVARISSQGKLLDDNFYNGQPWSIGLERFLRSGDVKTLDLKILPLRKDAPIYLQSASWPEFPASSEIDALKSIVWIPEYQLVIQSNSH